MTSIILFIISLSTCNSLDILLYSSIKLFIVNRDLSKSLCIPNKGLRQNKGDLYISINIILPDKELWNSQSIDFKEKLLNSLNALYKI